MQNNNTTSSLAALVGHMEHSFTLARLSGQLAAQADANDAELDRLVAQSDFTIDEVRDAMVAKWGATPETARGARQAA